jgi:hypothetical protein
MQTEMNKEKSRSNKQKPQYSANTFIASDVFFASEIGQDILKLSSFAVASQPHDIQGNSLLF